MDQPRFVILKIMGEDVAVNVALVRYVKKSASPGYVQIVFEKPHHVLNFEGTVDQVVKLLRG
jgi:hypothetical protein